MIGSSPVVTHVYMHASDPILHNIPFCCKLEVEPRIPINLAMALAAFSIVLV